MAAVFAGANPETYRPHALHDAERMWPETTCYVDLWSEVLNAFGTAPEAMTLPATEPSSRLFNAPRPCEPITTMS